MKKKIFKSIFALGIIGLSIFGYVANNEASAKNIKEDTSYKWWDYDGGCDNGGSCVCYGA